MNHTLRLTGEAVGEGCARRRSRARRSQSNEKTEPAEEEKTQEGITN